MDRAIVSPPNNPVERTAGSHSLAAAAHRDRWADQCQHRAGRRAYALFDPVVTPLVEARR